MMNKQNVMKEELFETKTNNFVKPDEDFGSEKKELQLKELLLLNVKAFSSDVSVHGIKQAAEPNFIVVKLFWLAVVLTALGYAIYSIQATITLYLAYPSVTKLSTKFEGRSQFPAVTICNLNPFQRTKITDMEAEGISAIYGISGFSPPTSVNLSDFTISLSDLAIKGAYSYTTPLCLYRNLPCDTQYITHVMTDHGICIKFDPSPGGDLGFLTRAGLEEGFRGGFAFDDEDYTVGPYFYIEGFRIAIHPPGTTVYQLGENGITLLPGRDCNVVLTRKQISKLGPPHGDCGTAPLKYFSTYTRRDCVLECQTDHTVSVCGCRLYYMPGNAQECTMKQTRECLATFWDMSDLRFDATTCNCPPDCTATTFTAKLQYTAFSKAYLQTILNVFGFQLSTNGVGMALYYEALEYVEEIEEKQYTIESLLSSLGGTAGLMLGCSLISIVELLYFILKTIAILITTCPLSLTQKKKVDTQKQ